MLLLIIGIFFVKTEKGAPDIGVIGNLVFLSVLVQMATLDQIAEMLL
ncbi:MAG: hypothetical protein HYS65_06925 [Betaproteobacteria bacterium]|nr:hypothetical protein [Betaproteobacteria bacterium]